MPVRKDPDDPISLLLTPPPDESPEERAIRLEKEADARRVSDAIDEQIKRDHAALKKQNILKMLILGQSESGKTTTLKNIQLIQAPETWLAERASWRIVIQLNLVRAVNTILDIVSAELSQPTQWPDFAPAPPTFDLSADGKDLDPAHEDEASSPVSPASPLPPVALSAAHSSLILRLSPLRRVEADLKRLLGAPSEEVTEQSLNGDHSAMVATPFENGSYPLADGAQSAVRRSREFCVRSHKAWKDSLSLASEVRSVASGRGGDVGADAAGVIAQCKDDIEELWADQCIREILARRKINLDNSAEYFLDRAHRIGSRNYEPTDDDVLHARLRTVGVQEYRLPLDRNNPKGRQWHIYDVGGVRTNRRVWLPYFEDVHAILFLAPISCFDEHLAEDRRVNRLKDSFILWKSIVSTKILEKATIILFLNKCDLLEKKLKSGVRVNKYIPRYGDRENKMSVFAKYIRDKFRDYMQEYSPVDRPFYGYLTSVVNKKATAVTIRSIQDSVLQNNLRDAAFV